MFTRISHTWEIMKASWCVLRQDKGLVLFPVFSGICCVIVLASFLMPLHIFHPVSVQTDDDRVHNIIFYLILFCFYFINYFVITFFNTAIIACAVSRLAGGEPSLSGGLREALRRIHLIAGWALVSATVGLALRMVAERSKIGGRIVVAILGGAWSIITFLAVPIMVVEEKGPIAAVKESTQLLSANWGVRLVGNFSFGLIFFLLLLPAFILVPVALVMTASLHSVTLLFLILGCAVTYVILLALIQSTLHSIFQAAVYVYTQGALVSPATAGGHGFPVELVRDAMYEK